jgi:hypothetical protein
MKTHVLFGIVAFLVRTIGAPCQGRLYPASSCPGRGASTHDFTGSATGSFRRNPFLGRSGKDQTARVTGDSIPGPLPEPGQPGLDEYRSCFEGLPALSDPNGPESLFFGYGYVWASFEGTSVGR